MVSTKIHEDKWSLDEGKNIPYRKDLHYCYPTSMQHGQHLGWTIYIYEVVICPVTETKTPRPFVSELTRLARVNDLRKYYDAQVDLNSVAILLIHFSLTELTHKAWYFIFYL